MQFCAQTPVMTLCLEKKEVTIKFNRTDTVRTIKQEVGLDACSRIPSECKTLQKKTNVLFGAGLKIPIDKIARVAMSKKEQDAEIVIEFSAELAAKFGGRPRLRLSGFPPRALERLTKELSSRVEKNHLVPAANWIQAAIRK